MNFCTFLHLKSATGKPQSQPVLQPYVELEPYYFTIESLLRSYSLYKLSSLLCFYLCRVCVFVCVCVVVYVLHSQANETIPGTMTMTQWNPAETRN